MIYTVTLNPSLDYVMHLEQLSSGIVNRSYTEEIYPGGKGINVSIVLNNLGIASKALGFIAGFTGLEIEHMTKKLGSDTDFITLKTGTSRINVKLETDHETEINATGPQISSDELELLLNKLKSIHNGDFLVLAGSVPGTVPSSIYEDIMCALAHKDVHIIVDATGDLLLNVLKYKPFLIKPNHLELAELFNVKINSDTDIITYAKKLQDMGAQNVLVSMGRDGSLLLTNEGEIMKIAAPDGPVINTVGSGDSMIAGFIAGYLNTGNLHEALKLASAAGSATALSSWLATKEKIYSLLVQLN